MNDKIEIEVDVKNTGKIEGKEVAQLYVRDVYATLTPPLSRLRGFNKIDLKPGEQKTIKFNLTVENLKYVGVDNKWTTEAGDFEFYVDKLKGSFFLKK